MVEIARYAIAGGATMLQLRDKFSTDRAVLAAATEIAHHCRTAHVPFIMNDRVDIAWASGADGVHLGHDDLPPALARKLLGERAVIGMSAGSEAELKASVAWATGLSWRGPYVCYAHEERRRCTGRTRHDAHAAAGRARNPPGGYRRHYARERSGGVGGRR